MEKIGTDLQVCGFLAWSLRYWIGSLERVLPPQELLPTLTQTLPARWAAAFPIGVGVGNGLGASGNGRGRDGGHRRVFSHL